MRECLRLLPCCLISDVTFLDLSSAHRSLTLSSPAALLNSLTPAIEVHPTIQHHRHPTTHCLSTAIHNLTTMNKLDHEMPPPSGWPTAWVNRDLPALEWYVVAVAIILNFTMAFIQLRCAKHLYRGRKELAANPSDRAAIFKSMHKRELKTNRGQFKIALAYMANTLIITLIDGFIALFVLVKDVSENAEVWDREMVIAVALYCVYLLVLFVASFILVPLLQMMAVTWALTCFSKKNNLSDYVPQARSCSTMIAFLWAAASFCVVCGWPVVGKSDRTATRFIVLEAVWGSALAWLEASFLFNYLSHAIGDKELSNGNGVGEVSI